MKIIILVIVIPFLFLLDCSCNQYSNEEISQFLNWKIEYGKKYDTEVEETYRRAIFIQSYRKVIEENSNPSNTYVAGLNQFSDQSDEEFYSHSTGVILTQQQQKKLNECNIPKQEKPKCLRRLKNLPKDKNWASDILTTLLISINTHIKEEMDIALKKFETLYQTKNQGSCKSCWAFAVTKLLSYQLAINKNEFQQFSEQQLIDCVNSQTSQQYLSYGCDGGYPNEALDYINTHGIYKLEEYQTEGPSYTGKMNSCKTHYLKNQNESQKPLIWTQKYKIIGNSEEEIIEALQHGPIVATINSSNWRDYKSGIFNNCSDTYIGHSVIIIGYSPTFWLIQNQWGQDWGIEGYMKLARNNNCLFPILESYQL